METTTGETNSYLNNQDGQYLDIPQLSEAAIEAKLRNLIRHRLGKCMNNDQYGSPDDARRDSGNVSPCEFCLQESFRETSSVRRLPSGDRILSDFKRETSSSIFPVETMSGPRDKGRRQSLQNFAMYTSMRPRVDKPSTRSFRCTKEELSAFLPRKSFFSCHDKALKDAGYYDTPVNRRTSRRQKKETVSEKVGGGGGTNVVKEEKKPSVSEETSNDPLLPTIVKSAMEQNQVPALSPGESGQGQTFSIKASQSRGKMEEDFQKNEHKAVTEYLKYVQDNPSEYIDHIRQLKAEETDVKPVERLIKTAMIYQRGHHGQSRSSLVVRASHDLKPRCTDPGQWQQVNKERNQVFNKVFNFNKDKKDLVPTKFSQEGDKEVKQEQEERKTELEKSRYKAEKWMKTVPMCQQLKARQMALEEVGEEDSEATQWWDALRTCHYIRNIGLDKSQGNVGSDQIT